jgi:hypothetical protein
MPSDLHEFVNKVFQKLFMNLSEPKLKDDFIKKLIEEFKKYISIGQKENSSD